MPESSDRLVLLQRTPMSVSPRLPRGALPQTRRPRQRGGPHPARGPKGDPLSVLWSSLCCVKCCGFHLNEKKQKETASFRCTDSSSLSSVNTKAKVPWCLPKKIKKKETTRKRKVRRRDAEGDANRETGYTYFLFFLYLCGVCLSWSSRVFISNVGFYMPFVVPGWFFPGFRFRV